MKIIHRAEDRGHFNFGWLDTHYSFSFGEYYHPEKTHFGALRVLNDDTIDGGRGFGMHGHTDAEIVTIPLEGAIIHEDNMGNREEITPNNIQLMSAGSGIMHSEVNASTSKPAKLLQLWILPAVKHATPRYAMLPLERRTHKNQLKLFISPEFKETGAWLNQEARLSIGYFESGGSFEYSPLSLSQSVYAFVIDGEFSIETENLYPRDAIGISDFPIIHGNCKKNGELLLIEVPNAI